MYHQTLPVTLCLTAWFDYGTRHRVRGVIARERGFCWAVTKRRFT